MEVGFKNPLWSECLLIMQLQRTKKQITVRTYATRSLILSTIYFIILLTWQTMVFVLNKESTSRNSAWMLLLFFVIFVVWFFCYFEIRTITKNEERFLGYKGYILFYLKSLYLPLTSLTTALIGKNTDKLIYLFLVNYGSTIIYYTCFVMFIRPYKRYIENNEGEIYISYNIRVKRWYHEGKVN